MAATRPALSVRPSPAEEFRSCEKASLEGARIVMSLALPSALRRSGLAVTRLASVESSGVAASVALRSWDSWAAARPARAAKREMCLYCMMEGCRLVNWNSKTETSEATMRID